MILSCLPGTSQAVQMALSCLPGASQAVEMVLSYLPSMDPFLPPWCLTSIPASLVPFRLSKWFFPASLVPPCQRQSCAPSGILKASLRYGQPTVEATPGFAANWADRHWNCIKVIQNPAPFQKENFDPKPEA